MSMSDEAIDRKLEIQRLLAWGVKHGMVQFANPVTQMQPATFKRHVYKDTREGKVNSQFYSPHLAKTKPSRYYIPPVIDSLKEAQA